MVTSKDPCIPTRRSSFDNERRSWRKIRKAGHEGFNARAVVAYRPMQEEYAARLVSALLTDPGKIDAHIRR